MVLKQNNERLYKGKAGQLHFMSLLLARGWNVAIPEVDTGDDIFVVRDRSGDFRKIQVKTTYTFNFRKDASFKVKFNIQGSQLLIEQPVELIYAFVVLDNMKFFPDIVIMERNQLVYRLTTLKQEITAITSIFT